MSEKKKQKIVYDYSKSELIRSWLAFFISSDEFLYRMKIMINLKV